MKVLGIAAQKGGVGKTTLTLHIAGVAASEGHRVAVVDVDKQGSASRWAETRDSESPFILAVDIKELREAVEGARNDGYDLLIIDSAPNHGSDIAEVARLSDLVVIPAKPSALDLPAIEPTIQIVQAVKGRCRVALNACQPGKNGLDASITTEARRYIEAMNAEPFTNTVASRAALSYALIGGELIHEYDASGKAHKEVRDLWHEIKAAL